MSENQKEQTTKKINDRPNVGPDPSFSQKVLQSFKEKPLTENEIKTKQQEWKKYTIHSEEKSSVNDFPNYFYAGFWIRLAAFLVDIICIGSVIRLTLGLAVNFGWLTFSGSYLSFYGLTALFVYLGYFILLTKLNHGQTIGKMIFGIRVICFNESELSWPTVFVREGACRFILKFPLLFVGYLPAMFSQKKQHVGDYFSNTSVVTLNLIKAFNQEVNA